MATKCTKSEPSSEIKTSIVSKSDNKQKNTKPESKSSSSKNSTNSHKSSSSKNSQRIEHGKIPLSLLLDYCFRRNRYHRRFLGLNNN